eukprot:3532893-Prymnesium_polylepis.2
MGFHSSAPFTAVQNIQPVACAGPRRSWTMIPKVVAGPGGRRPAREARSLASPRTVLGRILAYAIPTSHGLRLRLRFGLGKTLLLAHRALRLRGDQPALSLTLRYLHVKADMVIACETEHNVICKYGT